MLELAVCHLRRAKTWSILSRTCTPAFNRSILRIIVRVLMLNVSNDREVQRSGI